MLRSDFKYTGTDQGKREFVETVNKIAKLLNGMQVDLGIYGNTDAAKIEQRSDGLYIDLSEIRIENMFEYIYLPEA